MTEYCVVVLDKPGSDRSRYLKEHFTAITGSIESGRVLSGGQINSEADPVTGERFSIGSHIQIKADSREEVIEMLKHDIFAREDVWDLENAIIYQLDCAYRQEKKFVL